MLSLKIESRGFRDHLRKVANPVLYSALAVVQGIKGRRDKINY